MAKRIEAAINPSLLIWARRTAGRTVEEAAYKLRVPIERIEAFESGEKRPTINQARKLGNLYRRPIAVFFLPEPPKDFAPLHDYRRLPDQREPDPAEFTIEIRQAFSRREILIELLEESELSIPDFDLHADLSADAEQTGSLIRDFLGISDQDQVRWRTSYDALNTWRHTIERAGVLVFQFTGVSTSVARGFSIDERPLPVIGLNTSDAVNGRIFTLLHEFTHLMLGKGGTCDIEEEYRRPPEEERIEIFCNRAAAACIAPRALIVNFLQRFGSLQKREWSEEEIQYVANKLKISKEATLRRILTIGLTTVGFYQRKHDEYREEYERLRKRKTKGFVPPYIKVVSSSGIPYVRTILDSYNGDIITSSDLSDFLNVRLKHLPRIEQLARSKPNPFEETA